MPNTFFSFKRFTVNQERCAMKVGTDGVVLGATACFDGCSRLVDVGTGTGVVSLMLKQRFPSVSITAVEIDHDAATQASENFAASPWSFETVCDSWQNFAAEACRQGLRFDGVFCNPPYFTASLKAPSAERTLARHNDSLSFAELCGGVAKVLAEDGRFFVILPSVDMDSFVSTALAEGLFLQSVLYVHPVVDKPHKRVVLGFSTQRQAIVEEHLYIETAQRNVYTEQFISLVKDFYLNL